MCLEDVPNSCFPPWNGNGLTEPSSSCCLPPSAPSQVMGQVTAGGRVLQSLNCPSQEHAHRIW